MPVYRFALRDGSDFIQDEGGIALADCSHAVDYACEVARELMRGCEKQTRHWQLDVYDGEGNLAFAIPFATVDETLDGLEPSFRLTVENLSQVRRTLGESSIVPSSAAAVAAVMRACVSMRSGCFLPPATHRTLRRSINCR